MEQGVALTGRNTTGPPCVLPTGELRCIYIVLQTTVTPDTTTVTSLAPYTMCRLASNNWLYDFEPCKKFLSQYWENNFMVS